MMGSNKRKILFISDSSILNPILHSQGFPLLKILSTQYECSLLSFEYFKQRKNEKIKYEETKQKYKFFISFFNVEIGGYPVPYLLNYFFSGFLQAKKIIKRNKIDIIHARSLYPAIIGLFLKIRYQKIKLIYDNRGVFIQEQIYLGQWHKGGAKERVFKALEKLVLKKSDHVIVVSKVFYDLLLHDNPSLENLSVKISVINNKTYIVGEINSEDLEKRKNTNGIICIYSGSSAKWQNIDEIFSFAQNCISKLDNFRFKILTYESGIFKKKISNYKELQKISKISEVSSGEVFDQLLSANFGLLLRENNIINNVSSPLKFAEYLAAGLPVVVSEGVGDTAEIINHYNVGVVIKGHDFGPAIIKIKELLKQPDIYSRCMKVAKEEFNIEDSFKAYENIYSNL